jgi:hypothetical protein
MYITLSSLTLLFLLYSQFQSTFCYIDIDREHTLTVGAGDGVKNVDVDIAVNGDGKFRAGTSIIHIEAGCCTLRLPLFIE